MLYLEAFPSKSQKESLRSCAAKIKLLIYKWVIQCSHLYQHSLFCHPTFVTCAIKHDIIEVQEGIIATGFHAMCEENITK